ncbi:response regulator [Trichocoleus sp. FACHB-591]|uniref:response regulator n=1 Tax=Trichocoleus sp. FACHB-591 TaxID=2692872 RepID=UPI001687F2B3|nr:response regulator [Trichocoleus sp. FACHB-591]MBD2093567.1 response regulator [Trichocoleus sp. FACHB-591]
MRVLVVEDDLIVADAITRSLSEHHYSVDTAEDGAIGWECAESTTYDLILIDVGLPKLDGITLCQKIRDRGCGTPILLMTAKDDSTYLIRGLDSGADDYLAKPFDLKELQARVRALLRRGTVAASLVLTIGKLQLDPRSCQVTYADKLLPLTPKEYSLLELFLRHPSRVFSCGDIIEHLWTFDDPPQEESVKSHIKGLRQKLKTAGAVNWIENVYGLGYRLREGIETNQEQSTQSYDDQLAQLWEQYRGLMEERFAVLQQAVHTDPLSSELRSAAESAAHKLAGVLGMFDREEGTQIARQLEKQFEEQAELPDEAVRSLVQQLGDILNLSAPVETGKSFLDPSEIRDFDAEVLHNVRESKQALRSWTVLAVDDDPLILDTLKQLLEPWGMCLTGIDNPLQFWTVLSATNPDLLILDVEMPQMNGVALCQAIRANPTWQSLPIVFLTAHQDTATVQQIFAAGADDYVVKPIVGQELLSRLTQRLERLRLLQTLSTKDSITGLANQFYSSQAIAAQFRNHQTTYLAILYIPTLRQMNIEQGHGIGNQILKQTGQCLQSSFSNSEILGYWGNGEFIIASSQTTKAMFQERLSDVVATLQRQRLETPNLIYRFAVVDYPTDGLTLRSLYKTASLGLEGSFHE